MTCHHPHLPIKSLSAIPANNDDLHAEITTLAGHINAANYRFLKLLAALIERKAWNGHGIKSPAHWLNYYCGISLGPAREKVRVALALNDLPLIDAAFATGAISYSKVRAMTRVATPANEDYLLMIARHGTASHVEKLVRKYQRVERLTSDDQARTQHAARAFTCHYDDDGMLVFRGRLAPEDGALFMQAMDAVMDQALWENVSAETSDDQDMTECPDTFPQKRADALVLLAEHTLATARDGTEALKGGDKYQVVVHVSADQAWLEDGPYLAPQTVRRLADDAARVTLLEDTQGRVLNVGRKSRTVPPAMRRALVQRDGGCRFPGCCESKYVDAHHIHHWCDGGETRLDNLVLLCRRHHRLVHEAGYGIALDACGEPVFRSPDGHCLAQNVYPQFSVTDTENVSAETCLPLAGQHAALGLAIDGTTALSLWRGEAMDYDLGVAALQARSP